MRKRGRSCGALPTTTTVSLSSPRSKSPFRKEKPIDLPECSFRLWGQHDAPAPLFLQEPLTLGLRPRPCRSPEGSERGGFSPIEASCLSRRPLRLDAAIGLPALRIGV